MSGIPKERAAVLEAILDLPLGASLRDIAARVGRQVATVEHHLTRLKRTGHVQVVQRGFQKRRVIVPVRLRLSEVEAAWLRVGTITARAIVVVSRGNGKRVTSGEVAKTLGWHQGVARYHLERAKNAGLLESKRGAGYTLPCAHPLDREMAGLDERALLAVQYITKQGRRVSAPEVADAHDWTLACAKYHLKRAVKAGLLNAYDQGRAGGYEPTPNAKHVNWEKTRAASA